MNSTALREHCARELPATLEMLRQMVAINSFTENPDGINRLGKLTAECFAPLGFTPLSVQAADERFGRHLVMKSPPVSGAPTIALISHLDTVYTAEEEARNDFRWREDGARIYGPGTNDIKGGTALLHLTLSGLRACAKNVFAQTNWVVLLNACEEVISADFGNVCRAHLPANALAALIFEGDGDDHDGCSLVSARKGRATFTIEVEGRGAHAGGQHEHGANAVVQLARIVSEISNLTDYARGLTVNVGSLHGGTVANRVPHFASAEVEMRAFDSAIYAEAKRRILAHGGAGDLCSASADAHRCRIAVALGHETAPWPVNPATEKLLALWQASGRDLGLEVRADPRGGLSDGNVLWDAFPTVDGLGPRGQDCHCSERSADGSKVQEWVDVTSFVPKAVLNAAAIARLRGLTGS